MTLSFRLASPALGFLLFACCGNWAPLRAQTVQPLIAEYTEKGAGSFVVTNSSFQEVAVVLEPESFSIDPDGKGMYRALDGNIHLQLSKTSLRLGPRESQSVFYKVSADTAPAWLTVYATFAPLHPGPGVNVHIMLPHTIYLYSKRGLTREDVEADTAEYDAQAHKVICRIADRGKSAGRAQGTELSSGKSHASGAGFPLLPGSPRRLELPWDEPTAPTMLSVSFDRFTLKLPVVPAAKP